MVRVRQICQAYEKSYTTKDTDERLAQVLQRAIVGLYVAAMELVTESDRLLGGNMPAQMLHAIMHPDKAKGLVADLENGNSCF